jgi:mRNA-degrading endonuclease YafQ of YafQ-DinJ toxin-antitoxin module
VKIKVDKSFIKDFNKISDKDIKAKIKLLLKNLEKIENFSRNPKFKEIKRF